MRPITLKGVLRKIVNDTQCVCGALDPWDWVYIGRSKDAMPHVDTCIVIWAAKRLGLRVHP